MRKILFVAGIIAVIFLITFTSCELTSTSVLTTETLETTTSITTASMQPIEIQDVRITYIFYDGLVPRVESDEYVEIKNFGDKPKNLLGWVLKDISEGYPSFTFPDYILGPGQSIRVYTNEIHPEYGGFSFGRGSAIWNNSEPDMAALYDNNGNEVSRKSY